LNKIFPQTYQADETSPEDRQDAYPPVAKRYMLNSYVWDRKKPRSQPGFTEGE
jgi:hypothetical protein